MSSRESITMVKSDDRKNFKLWMLAESSKKFLEVKERISRSISSSTPPPDWLVEVMRREENAYNPKLIIWRKLYESDLSKSQSRLSFPSNQLVTSDFLTEEETTILHEHSVLKNRKEGLSVVLVDPLLNRYEVELKKWKIGQYLNYVLVGGWNKVVPISEFEVSDITEIWSFRYEGGKLCFALSPPVRYFERSGQSSSRRS